MVSCSISAPQKNGCESSLFINCPYTGEVEFSNSNLNAFIVSCTRIACRTTCNNRANRAILLISRELRNIEHPPPKIMFDIFDTLIMPILAYGSDVWGSNKDSIDILDKVFLRFIRCTLGIKATTSNTIVAGERGRLPPSTQCILHTLCYVNRIIHMNGTSLVKQVLSWRAKRLEWRI